MRTMPKKKPLPECRVEVFKDENESHAIAVKGIDAQGNEAVGIAFSLETAKDVAYTMLNYIYRLENGLPIPDEGRNDENYLEGDDDDESGDREA